MRITLQKRYNSHLRDKNVTILTCVTKTLQFSLTLQKRYNSHRDKSQYHDFDSSLICENFGMIYVIFVLKCMYNMHAIAHYNGHARIAPTFFRKVALDNKWLLWPWNGL